MINEERLRDRINELTQELHSLQERRIVSNSSEKNGDVYTTEEERTVGSQAEIERVRTELAKLNEELKKVERGKETARLEATAAKEKTSEYEKRRLQQEQEKAEYEESQRKFDFKKIKQLYKKNSAWDRFIYMVQGKSPNWKKISNYSLQQLEYLLKVRDGNTSYQKSNEKDLEKRNNEKRRQGKSYYSDSELNEMNNQAHLTAFNAQLMNQTKMQQFMETEEKMGRRR